MGLVFSIYNFSINKTYQANNWHVKKNTFLREFGFRLFLFVTGLDSKVKNIVKEIKVLMFFRSMAVEQKESWKL